MPPAGFDVEGWKDIVAVVGRSENTCRKLASRERDPLPVRSYLGKPVAVRVELQRWVSKQTWPFAEDADEAETAG